MRTIATVLLATMGLFAGANASATLIGIGDTLDVSFDCATGSPCGGGNAPGNLSTDLSLTLLSGPVSSGSNYLWTLAISILNDSSIQEFVDAFAMDVTPDVNGATFIDDGALDWKAFAQDSLAGSHTFDLCITDSNNSQCNGGAGSTGLGMGDSDSMILQISTASPGVGGLDLSNFRIKWTGAYGSFETGGGDGCLNCTTVPEPGTLSLVGAGLIALGFIRRRRATA